MYEVALVTLFLWNNAQQRWNLRKDSFQLMGSGICLMVTWSQSRGKTWETWYHHGSGSLYWRRALRLKADHSSEQGRKWTEIIHPQWLTPGDLLPLAWSLLLRFPHWNSAINWTPSIWNMSPWDNSYSTWITVKIKCILKRQEQQLKHKTKT